MKKVVNYIIVSIIAFLIGILMMHLSEHKKLKIDSIYSSLVYIESESEDYLSSGTGFVYKVQGNRNYIVTNYHIINNGKNIYVYNINGKKEVGTLINYDLETDIAIISIDDNLGLDYIKLGNSNNISVGDYIYIVGNPLNDGYIGTVMGGIVSFKNRIINYNNKKINTIQIDAAINEGNSGGPLINEKGQVIGIVFIKEKDLNDVGFALPSNDLKNIIKRLENNK